MFYFCILLSVIGNLLNYITLYNNKDPAYTAPLDDLAYNLLTNNDIGSTCLPSCKHLILTAKLIFHRNIKIWLLLLFLISNSLLNSIHLRLSVGPSVMLQGNVIFSVDILRDCWNFCIKIPDTKFSSLQLTCCVSKPFHRRNIFLI